MCGSDARTSINHRLDLALEPECTNRALLFYVRANLGQAIVAPGFLEQLSIGRAKFRRIGAQTQVFGVWHEHGVRQLPAPWGDSWTTPSSFWLRPIGVRNSSNSTSPGWMLGKAFKISSLVSVVMDDFHVVGVALQPT